MTSNIIRRAIASGKFDRWAEVGKHTLLREGEKLNLVDVINIHKTDTGEIISTIFAGRYEKLEYQNNIDHRVGIVIRRGIKIRTNIAQESFWNPKGCEVWKVPDTRQEEFRDNEKGVHLALPIVGWDKQQILRIVRGKYYDNFLVRSVVGEDSIEKVHSSISLKRGNNIKFLWGITQKGIHLVMCEEDRGNKIIFEVVKVVVRDERGFEVMNKLERIEDTIEAEDIIENAHADTDRIGWFSEIEWHTI